MAKKTKLKSLRKNMKEATPDIETVKTNPLLNKTLLKGYQRNDNIILNNFENITQLEVSENHIDYLDLSTLKQLQVLQCKGNVLGELIVDGRNLLRLTATHNDLSSILILSEPTKLNYLDISFNKFKELPLWITKCKNLNHLSANDNSIKTIIPEILNNDNIPLYTLQLGNNKLSSFPDLSRQNTNLQKIQLHGNELEKLPQNFFSLCSELRFLNISYNRLKSLPDITNEHLNLENLLATNNLLDNTALEVITKFKTLKILHLAYNNLTSLTNTFIQSLKDLEELIVSGNKLEELPHDISSLKKLRVLRLHSNLIKTLPDISCLISLQVLDLAHNQLSKINLEKILPKKIKFLDLSCNLKLQVDSAELKTFQSRRSIRFVDVTGKDRFCLPTSVMFRSNTNSFSPWKLGFSETPGNCPKLWVSQLRLPQFCNTEGLFGMFDGQESKSVMSSLPKIIPTILLQHRGNRANSAEYMRYTLISAFENLKSNQRMFDNCAVLCHIAKENECHGPTEKIRRSKKYILRVAAVGETSAFLITKQGPFHLPPALKTSKKNFQTYSNLSNLMKETNVFEMTLRSDDEYLVMCSKNVCRAVRIETIIQEIQKEENLVLAAKKIQDIAQSFGVEQNISIIILKFQNVESYVDRLMSELKQNARNKSNVYKCPSCITSREGSNFENRNNFRSSPIGQSDQEISELSVCLKRIESDAHCFAEGHVSSIKSQSHAGDNISRVLEEESDITETDSLLSDEQYKCWEYMLEQNTQLLFDKELNKITNLFMKHENSASSGNLNSNKNSSYFEAAKSKMSSSFPQLICRDVKEFPPKHTKSTTNFGSATSFQQYSLLKARSNQNARDRLTAGSGDTNLGYFGSLQQLLPYNFENEFEITHERKVGGGDDSSEYASRINQYWGVTSTEL